MKYLLAVSSIIEKDVSIGEGTQIWYFAHIREGTKIGRDCNIGENCVIGEKVMIGDNVKIGAGCFIPNGVIIKDNVRILPGVKFTNIRKPSIKKSQRYLDTIVNEDVVIEANATIAAGVKIGKGARIGNGANVIGDILPETFAAGNPARFKKLKSNPWKK